MNLSRCVCVWMSRCVCVLLNVHLICLSTVQDHQKYSIAKNTWFIAMFQHQKCLAVPDVVSSILEAYFKMLFLSSLICTFFAQDFSRFACLMIYCDALNFSYCFHFVVMLLDISERVWHQKINALLSITMVCMVVCVVKQQWYLVGTSFTCFNDRYVKS